MVEISNVKVYDLEECIIASGNAMRTTPVIYTQDELVKGIKRMRKLVHASNSTAVHCHDNALTGIRVSFDVKYPQYWSMEFQRYHFADIVTSSSKMHRLLKMDLTKACNKYVTKETINNLNMYISNYNGILDYYTNNDLLDTEEAKQKIYEYWMKVISNTPMGLELFMRVSTNYKQLQTIYHQRKNHKLKEDWGAFIQMIEDLPYFKQLILGEPDYE